MYDLEPSPGGNRVNLGAYGNTPEASKSAYTLTPGRVRIVETADTFNTLNQALVSLANLKSPFTQNYTVQLDSGTYYETARPSATIDTGNYQLTIERAPGVSTAAVVLSGSKTHIYGIALNFTGNSRARISGLSVWNYLGPNSDGMGIMLNGGTVELSSNSVFSNYYGLYVSSVSSMSVLSGNIVSDNSRGIYAVNARLGLLAANNIFYSTSTASPPQMPVYLDASPNCRIKNNDFYIESAGGADWRYGVYFVNTSSGAIVKHNAFYMNGNGTYMRTLNFMTGADQAGAFIDYNDYYTPGVAKLAYWSGGEYTTLKSWQDVSGLDKHSVYANPLWVSTGTLDFHQRSTAGRWNPVTQQWVADAQDSPAIDTGDPDGRRTGAVSRRQQAEYRGLWQYSRGVEERLFA